MSALDPRYYTVVESGCWEWNLSRLPNGYGRVGPKRGLLAHRWSWTIHRGPIPAGLCVLHRCDNRCCVRPDHLFLGSKKDNSQDALHKGRLDLTPPSSRVGWHPGRSIGEVNGSAKLTRAAVEAARAAYRGGGVLQRELAERYGVSQVAISKALRGETWA